MAAKEELSPADKHALEIATDLATQFRRVLDGLRTFPPGHKTLKGYFDGLLERLQQVTSADPEVDEYSLDVTPMGFKHKAHLLNPAESLADSLTHPLYLDGVQQLAFSRGVTMEDLATFIDIWRATLDAKLGDTHTFCTRAWEADLATVHVVAAETFSEGGGSDGKTKGELQAVVDGFSGLGGGGGDALVGTSGIYTGTLSRVSRITKNDLAELRAQGIPEMTPEDLARYDGASQAPIAQLGADELAALATELAAVTTQQIERATEAMFQSGVRASPRELEELQRAFALVVSAMVRAGMVARLHQVLAGRVAAARRGEVADMAARFEVLTQLMGCLLSPVVLEPLVEALDDEKLAAEAAEVLRFLPAHAASTLLEWLGVPVSDAGRRVLSQTIITLRPDVAELAERIGWADEPLALELLHVAGALAPEAGWPVREAALRHASPAVRRAAVSHLPKELILAHRAVLIPLLASPDPAIRAPLFAPFVHAGDPGVTAALAKLLKQRIDDAERRRIIVAMGTIGDPDACAALRAELTTQSDVELKCLAATALGHAGDEQARPLLEEAAHKVFAGGELKKAAQAALKRLDQFKTGSKR